MIKLAAILIATAYAVAESPALTLSLSCDLSDARIQVPANQTQLVAPDYAPHYTAIAVGVQNYTCDAVSSTYTLIGAVAELFDCSCLYGTPAFNDAPAVIYKAWKNASGQLTPQQIIDMLSDFPVTEVLGQHYYVPNPSGSGLSPKWDFTSSGANKGDANAYMIGAKIGDLPSLNPQTNIDSLMVKNIQGDLADLVFRVNNNGGQPSASCSEGSEQNITVRYASQYWFFGGSE